MMWPFSPWNQYSLKLPLAISRHQCVQKLSLNQANVDSWLIMTPPYEGVSIQTDGGYESRVYEYIMSILCTVQVTNSRNCHHGQVSRKRSSNCSSSERQRRTRNEPFLPSLDSIDLDVWLESYRFRYQLVSCLFNDSMLHGCLCLGETQSRPCWDASNP